MTKLRQSERRIAHWRCEQDGQREGAARRVRGVRGWRGGVGAGSSARGLLEEGGLPFLRRAIGEPVVERGELRHAEVFAAPSAAEPWKARQPPTRTTS